MPIKNPSITIMSDIDREIVTSLIIIISIITQFFESDLEKIKQEAVDEEKMREFEAKRKEIDDAIEKRRKEIELLEQEKDGLG